MATSLRYSLFRFKNRRGRILAVYECIVTSEKRSLHPIEISRRTGLHMLDVIEVIEEINEIFLRVPSPDIGVNRFALRPSIAAQSQDEVIGFINRKVKIETYVYYAIIAIIVNAIIVVLFSAYPYFKILFS